jgi:hypothetical protein
MPASGVRREKAALFQWVQDARAGGEEIVSIVAV